MRTTSPSDLNQIALDDLKTLLALNNNFSKKREKYDTEELDYDIFICGDIETGTSESNSEQESFLDKQQITNDYGEDGCDDLFFADLPPDSREPLQDLPKTNIKNKKIEMHVSEEMPQWVEKYFKSYPIITIASLILGVIVGGCGGGVAGGLLGGMIGTCIFPGIGTAIGAGIGAVIGGVGGFVVISVLCYKAMRAMDRCLHPEAKMPAEIVSDNQSIETPKKAKNTLDVSLRQQSASIYQSEKTSSPREVMQLPWRTSLNISA